MDEWEERRREQLLGEVRVARRRQRAWGWIALAWLGALVLYAALRWSVLTDPGVTREAFFAVTGAVSLFFFLALVAATAAVWYHTRVREARYLLALLGAEKDVLIRNIVDPQTGKPAVEVDRGLWRIEGDEVVRVEPPR